MKKYFIVENNQQTGPLSKDELNGRINPSSLVWTEGMTNWEQASTIGELNDLFMAPPPPPSAYQTSPPPLYSNYSPPANSRPVYQPIPDTGNAGGGLIAVAYLLALLGGIGGIITGSVLWMGKENMNGEKVKKYTSTGQLHGAFAFFLGIIVWAACVEMFLK